MIAASPTELTALAGANSLRDRIGSDDPDALAEVAVQFEALVMNLMLKAARDSIPGDSAFDGQSTQQYLELMDREVALALARQGGLGLGKMLGVEPAPIERVTATARTRLDAQPDARGFVEQLMPHARSAAVELGVDPKLLVAQAALESGWGRAALSHANGLPANNLFAIKTGSDWQGESVGHQTLEFVDGVPERRFERFRAYPDLAAGVADYVGLIKRMTGTPSSVNAPTAPENFVEALTRAGYATDPDYGNKWLAVYRGDRLDEAFAEAL
ncbi:MAG: hypothetical protein HKN84_01455 [Gammaproteobacteria bacterium]|nr:hypothetical protein [Gammaproteobacteria bacterium]